jgi:anionic cell wall polymer biosynthesis LytR-Cps2A-Psr (LCP) family protein
LNSNKLLRVKTKKSLSKMNSPSFLIVNFGILQKIIDVLKKVKDH